MRVFEFFLAGLPTMLATHFPAPAVRFTDDFGDTDKVRKDKDNPWWNLAFRFTFNWRDLHELTLDIPHLLEWVAYCHALGAIVEFHIHTFWGPCVHYFFCLPYGLRFLLHKLRFATEAIWRCKTISARHRDQSLAAEIAQRAMFVIWYGPPELESPTLSRDRLDLRFALRLQNARKSGRFITMCCSLSMRLLPA